MITFEQFKIELQSIEPDLEAVNIHDYKGFRHQSVSPAHEFAVIDLFVENMGFIHVLARDSFDENILDWLVQFFNINRKKKYDQNYLHVFPVYNSKTFDSIGLCPPPIAQTYKAKSTVLAEYGYWLFPMYGIEFLDKFTGDQFWTQIRRKDRWKVEIVDWARKIQIIRGK